MNLLFVGSSVNDNYKEKQTQERQMERDQKIQEERQREMEKQHQEREKEEQNKAQEIKENHVKEQDGEAEQTLNMDVISQEASEEDKEDECEILLTVDDLQSVISFNASDDTTYSLK
jgi:flagellar motor protein MotB